MDTRCPICDPTDLDARERPNDHPHHAKVRGRRCGRFVDWLTRPSGPIPDHCLDAARPRPAPVELVGSKDPVRWANSGDGPMGVQTRIDCDKCKPLVLDDQGIDSGSSGVMRRLKGSLDLGGKSDRAFRAGINAPARTATLTPTAPARVGAGA